MAVAAQPLRLTGIAIARLEPFERNKIARKLDCVGFIPVLGSVTGLVRLIAGVVVMIFCCIKAACAEGEKKAKLLMWRTIAHDEALRGLFEMTWVLNIIFAASIGCSGVDRSFDDNSRTLNDQQYVETKKCKNSIQGFLSKGFPFAHGNYIYRDNSERDGTVHYSYKKYEGNQVIWRSLIGSPTRDRDSFKGTEGVVLKEGYVATVHPTEDATYLINTIPEK